MKRRVVLLGPPGSGKGTVAQELGKKYGLVHLSTGQWFRREMSLGTRAGLLVHEYISRGELAPDEVVLSLISHWLSFELLHKGFLLDGLPRTIPQAEGLERFCEAHNAPIDAVLFFSCPEEVILNRVTGRRVCPTCGAGYHVRNLPPSVPGICDRCGSPLVQREDDREEVVRERLQVYRRLTEPLVEYYRKRGKLITLNAGEPIEKLTKAAEIALEA